MLLVIGAFLAMKRCLWSYSQHEGEMSAEQMVEGARSAVDFHLLVNRRSWGEIAEGNEGP